VLAVRAAALAQSGRSEEAAKATEALLGHFPNFTV
jgi:adenylate cyclase